MANKNVSVIFTKASLLEVEVQAGLGGLWDDEVARYCYLFQITNAV